DEVVVAVDETGCREGVGAAGQLLIDANLEAPATFGLEIRVVGEPDLERIGRANARSPARANACRRARLFAGSYQVAGRDFRIQGVHRLSRKRRTRREHTVIRLDRVARDVFEAQAAGHREPVVPDIAEFRERAGHPTADRHRRIGDAPGDVRARSALAQQLHSCRRSEGSRQRDILLNAPIEPAGAARRWTELIDEVAGKVGVIRLEALTNASRPGVGESRPNLASVVHAPGNSVDPGKRADRIGSERPGESALVASDVAADHEFGAAWPLPAYRARHVREAVVVVGHSFARRWRNAPVAEAARVFGSGAPTPVAVGSRRANRRAGRSLAAPFDKTVDAWTAATSRHDLHDRADGIGPEKR